uniref:CARDB domain-containing protein n=1 Tax=uncultured marine group II/III euryarchaeote KM3_87_G11 TaxID=1456534 RepID=A0A075HW90_9EURY|nr:hypothetical protein [uncultured marine group II/III euryarchaeote KM3_87_G11]
MRSSRSAVLAICVTALFVFAVPSSVYADTVIRSETVDLLPEGTFENSTAWDVTSWPGYTVTDPAEYTTGMVTDGHLSFTHSRPEYFTEGTGWALYSPSESNMSLGVPDGGYTWSKGPTIDLENFDSSAFYGSDIINVSVKIAFAVPEVLGDDEVRFQISWGSNMELIRSFAHTQAPIDNMQGNPLVISLDSYASWTWNDLNDLTVTIDYVSVGGVDDSEVRVDAVGLQVRERSPWSGFENSKAVHSSVMEMAPFFDFDIAAGSLTGLHITSCGLEIDSVGNPGGWLSESVQLPHDQTWGRYHQYGNASASVKIQSSSDGISWSTGVTINDAEMVNGGNYVRLDIAIFDGCLAAARIDLNDPTLTITGSVSGSTADLVSNFSVVKFALGTNLVATTPVLAGAFSLTVPVGRFLPDAGESLDIGVSSRFQWSSQGQPETVVVQVEDILLSGGFLVEWDYDPSCENPGTIYLQEDDIGSITPLRSTCSDDITPVEQLSVSAVSQTPTLVAASVDDGRLVLSQLSEQSGVAPIDVVVTDERGNTWTTTFDVVVSSVEDAPTHAQLPQEVLVAVGDALTIELQIEDVDTPINDLIIATDVSWAIIDSYNNLILAPTSVGSFEVKITISDGPNVVTESLIVLATSDPDLLIESVEVEGEVAGQIERGVVTSIKVFVRNEGLSAASLVSVRCYDGQTLINTSVPIPVIEPNGLGVATCVWLVPVEAGDVSLRVYVDPTYDILEVSETNNEYHSTIEVVSGDDEGGGAGSGEGAAKAPSMSMVYVLAVVIGLVALIAMQLGPGKIRREL